MLKFHTYYKKTIRLLNLYIIVHQVMFSITRWVTQNTHIHNICLLKWRGRKKITWCTNDEEGEDDIWMKNYIVRRMLWLDGRSLSGRVLEGSLPPLLGHVRLVPRSLGFALVSSRAWSLTWFTAWLRGGGVEARSDRDQSRGAHLQRKLPAMVRHDAAWQ